jgi:hypothetical protein
VLSVGVVDRPAHRGAEAWALTMSSGSGGAQQVRRCQLDCPGEFEDKQRETTLSWLKVVRNWAFRSLTPATSIHQLNTSVPSLRDCGSAAIAAADARERILPGRQAEVAFSRFRRLRIRRSHDAISALSESKWFPALSLRLWLSAESGTAVRRPRKQKLGEQTGVRLPDTHLVPY